MFLSVKELVEQSDELKGYAMVKRMKDMKGLSRDSITVEPLTPTKSGGFGRESFSSPSTPNSNNNNNNNNNSTTNLSLSSSMNLSEMQTIEQQVQRVLEGDTSVFQQISLSKLKLTLRLLIEKEEKIIAQYEKMLVKER